MPFIDLPDECIQFALDTDLMDCSVGRAYATFKAVREAAIRQRDVDAANVTVSERHRVPSLSIVNGGAPSHDAEHIDTANPDNCPACVVLAEHNTRGLPCPDLDSTEHNCGVW